MAIMAYNNTIRPNTMINVAIVAFEGISLFHLSVPIAIFKDAAPSENALFKIKVCGETTGKIITASGISIDIESDISAIRSADIVIIPSWLPNQTPNKPLLDALKFAHDNNKRIVGLCLGAYALGYAGLLNHKRATTHWKYGDDFQAKFPAIDCDINLLFVEDDNVTTSAGSAAAIDCCLHIVKHYYGVKTANKIARVMVSSPERSGGQNQYIESPTLSRPQDERIAKLIDNVLNNITTPYTLASAADYCMMSVRNFSRSFKATNGISFTAWLINARLKYSQELLESTNLSISQVAHNAGFSSEQNFRKHFNKRYDTSPNKWRSSFKNEHAQ